MKVDKYYHLYGRKDDMVFEEVSVPEPHWIPVAERLPDKDGRYLVTCSKIGAWIVDWNIWHCEPKPGWLWEQGVTAWMPLPEPWEGEEKND